MDDRTGFIFKEKVRKKFESVFNHAPEVLVRAPGRINLIGEHTDYNNGFVLPAAVSQSIYFAIGKAQHADECNLISIDFDQRYRFKLTEMVPLEADSWQNYILGVAAEILKTGRRIEGFNMVFSGNVPRGSGMSSSAALECGTCYALSELFDLKISKVEMVKLSQMAEHNYAGVKCGIMDQFASMMGKSSSALMLDCRSLDYSYFPVGLGDNELILLNSNVTHSLASSEYNIRRAQCEEAIAALNDISASINSLRDVSIEMLLKAKPNMNEVVYRRAKYVIEENERVTVFARAISSGNLRKAGEILTIAHNAMRYDYEITCPEIDFITNYVTNHKEVLGARMMGGGFGGCVLVLVKKGVANDLNIELNNSYEEEYKREVTLIEVDISDGVAQT